MHTSWLPNEIMDEEDITFVLLLYYWVKTKNRTRRRKHRHIIADASQSSSGTSAMDHLNYRRHYYIKYTSPMFSRTCREHRRCVADVSATFWTLVYLSESSSTVVRWSALFDDISRMVLDDETSGENFNACIQIFLGVLMPWWNMAIHCVRCRSFAKQLVHRGSALAMPKFVHP